MPNARQWFDRKVSSTQPGNHRHFFIRGIGRPSSGLTNCFQDSIAINGCCLTVVEVNREVLESPELISSPPSGNRGQRIGGLPKAYLNDEGFDYLYAYVDTYLKEEILAEAFFLQFHPIRSA